ncbi:lysozyme inhibitor LprI family protein [Terricaulis sp.]|uniref:lysozyme inhibitor LprI family protein n=1 Tax=Terricaulis sp. TaxID=2768686 RepID=UPI003785087C
MRGMWAAFAVAIAAFACLTPQASAQQDADADIPGCVERAGASLARLQKCKGVQADPCSETDSGSTTSGAMMCWQAEGGVWGALMDQAIARAREGATPARTQALADSQERWLAWRQSECRYQALYFEGGSLSRVIAAHCVADLTADRAIALLYTERNADQ